ncbi:MAG: isochorismatase family protein [Pirellulaceae bacterium]
MNPHLDKHDALIIVDMQNDFCPGGALPVQDCDSVVSTLNRWLECASQDGAKVIASRDWHPPDHSSFQEQGGNWPRHCMQTRTQEILAGLGVIENFLNEGIAVRHFQLHDVDRGSMLLSVPLEELASETTYPHLLILPQSRTEKLLLDALLQEPTAEVAFESEVTGVSQINSRVRVNFVGSHGPSSVDARFVAGCDGAHSTVRQAIGASFDGLTYKMRAALADVSLEGVSDLPFPRITTRPVIAIGIKMEKDLWRLILPFSGSDSLPLDDRVAAAVTGLFDRDYRLVWQSSFHLHRRVSSKFASGRIVLAGDAAHLSSPVGGQGMNAGIQDAELLVKAMVEALDRNSSDPLEAYAHRRRREIREGVNRFTDLLTRVLLFRRGRMLRPLLRLANASMRIPPVRRRFLRRLAMLD